MPATGSSVAAPDAKAATRQLLTYIYQSTQHSSAQTLAAARAVAEEIGARFELTAVQDTVEKAEAFLAENELAVRHI